VSFDRTTLIAIGGAVLLLLIVVLIVHAVRKENARVADIRRWAAAAGWSFTKRQRPSWEARMPGTYRRGVSLSVSGQLNGRPVSVAEYWYMTESTSAGSSGGVNQTSTTTHLLVVTAVRLPVRYPPIAVQPRGSLSRMGRAVFGDNAAATGHAEFDRRFRVRTKDPAAARALVGPALIADHLAGRVPAWSLGGQDLLTWRDGKIRDPREIPAMASALTWVADRLGH
jgi:hypothetical protein